MAVASDTDVANRLGRPLTSFETSRVNALLDDIEVEIRRVAPDRLTDPTWKDAVVSVECSIAIRVSRMGNAVSAEVPQTESIGFPNNPTYQKIELYRSDRRTLGLPLVESVRMNAQSTPVTAADVGAWDGWDCGWW